MPDYRRFYIPNSIVFITCVTKDRFPYLQSKKDLEYFFATLRNVSEITPYELLAYAILPDHFHWLMRVDEPSGNFSKIMHSIKRNFTYNYKKVHKINTPLSLWQRGFWDHVIRDERDLELHFDYIHWNPVKHGYASKPEDWLYSTCRDWMGRGFYKPGWGWTEEPKNITGMDFE